MRSQDPERLKDEDTHKSYEFAEKNFSPLYFIRSYPSDKKKIEMSFDLTNYQPQVGVLIRCWKMMLKPSFAVQWSLSQRSSFSR